jgi:hypothetical protein
MVSRVCEACATDLHTSVKERLDAAVPPYGCGMVAIKLFLTISTSGYLAEALHTCHASCCAWRIGLLLLLLFMSPALHAVCAICDLLRTTARAP